MPEPLRYQQRREDELDQQRSVRVPEIVQPDVMQPGQSFMFFHVLQYGFLEELKSRVSGVAP